LVLNLTGMPRCRERIVADETFYARYGFLEIAGLPQRMFLPMRIVEDLLRTQDR